jgi:hypothetical protein
LSKQTTQTEGARILSHCDDKTPDCKTNPQSATQDYVPVQERPLCYNTKIHVVSPNGNLTLSQTLIITTKFNQGHKISLSIK